MQIAAVHCGCITLVGASMPMVVVEAGDGLMRQVIHHHNDNSTCLHACIAEHAGGAYDKLGRSKGPYRWRDAFIGDVVRKGCSHIQASSAL